MNMQDVRNELDVMTIRSKMEKSHLARISHIARMSDFFVVVVYFILSRVL